MRFRFGLLQKYPPILFLEDFVGFPYLKFVLLLRKAEQVEALRSVRKGGKIIICPSAKLEKQNVSTLCVLEHKASGVDGTRAILRGLARVSVISLHSRFPVVRAGYRELEERDNFGGREQSTDIIELMKNLRSSTKAIPEGLVMQLEKEVSPGRLADLCMYDPYFSLEQRREILSTVDSLERIRKVRAYLKEQVNSLKSGWGGSQISECEVCDDFAERAYEAPPLQRFEIGRKFLEHAVERHPDEVLGVVLQRYGPYFAERRALR